MTRLARLCGRSHTTQRPTVPYSLTEHSARPTPPPATQLPRRSPDNVAGAPEPSSRRPHTPAPSPAHPATQLRTRPPPTQRQRRHARPTQQPPHEAPTQRHTHSDAAPHDVTRAPEQSIRAPHSYPTAYQRSGTGRGAKHHRAPSTTGQLGYTTTPRTSSMTRRNPTECRPRRTGVPIGITPVPTNNRNSPI